MKVKVYVIRDAATETFLQPHFLQTKSAAIRAFADLVNDGKSQVSLHAKDFSLFEIAEYDDSSGMITPWVQPIHVITALECLSDDIKRQLPLPLERGAGAALSN